MANRTIETILPPKEDGRTFDTRRIVKRFCFHLRATVRSARAQIFLLGLLSIVIPANAQLKPTAPVEDFRLPMFNDAGNKIWDLHGDKGNYINEDRVDIIDMELRIFTGTADDKVETVIRSPKAQVHIKENEVVGTDKITVINPAYHIEGENWKWDGNEKSVLIHKNVLVTFYEGIGDILR